MEKQKTISGKVKDFFTLVWGRIKRLEKKKKMMLFAVLAAVLAALFIAGLAFGGKKTKQAAVMPETTRLQTGDFSERISASGTTRATNTESIFIELSQEVKEVFAEVGDKVEKGRLLVTYDIDDTKRELSNKLAEAEANLESAELALLSIASPAAGTELIDLKSQVISAQKNLSDAEHDLSTVDSKIEQAEKEYASAKTLAENYKALYELGGVTKTEYDSALTSCENARLSYESTVYSKTTCERNVESAKLALEKAQTNLSVGLDKLSDKDNAQNYKKQQNAVNTARLNLESIEAEISKLAEATYSPIDGTVTESNAVAGQMLSDSAVMMKIADLSDISLTAYVSEYDISKVKAGQKVEMTSDGIEGKTYNGTVTRIEPAAVSQSTISGSETVVEITVHMDDSDENVRPGVSFDMEIIVTDLKDAQYLPISAIIMDTDGKSYVYVVDESGRLAKTPVETGANNDTNMQVLSGVSESETVVSSPTDAMEEGKLLSDYQTIKYVEPQTRQSGESGLFNGIMPNGGGMQGGGMQGGGMPGGGRAIR